MVSLRAFLTGLPRGVMNLGVKDSLGVLTGVFGALLGRLTPPSSPSPFRRGDLDSDGEWNWDGGQDTGGAAAAAVVFGDAGRGVIGAELISFAGRLILISLLFLEV